MYSAQGAGSGASYFALHVNWATSGRLHISLTFIFLACKMGITAPRAGAREVLSTGPGICYLPSTGKFNAEQMCWLSLIPHWPQPGGPSLCPGPSGGNTLTTPFPQLSHMY